MIATETGAFSEDVCTTTVAGFVVVVVVFVVIVVVATGAVETTTVVKVFFGSGLSPFNDAIGSCTYSNITPLWQRYAVASQHKKR